MARSGGLACLTALSLLVLTSCTRPPAPPDIWGVWTGNAHGQELTFGFQEDGDCRLEFRDTDNGEVRSLKGRYAMDFSKRPVPISIRRIPQLPHALHAIVAFQQDGTIHLSQFSDRWRLRPVAFEPGKTIILSRTKDISQ